MAKTTIKLLTLTLLTLMLLAIAPTFVAAQPQWQAHPMYKIAGHVDPNTLDSNSPYFAPEDIKAAYNLPSTGGSGTIAIIDAYDNPKVATDLELFSQAFGLPSADLEIQKMALSISQDSGWAMETSLDVQWAHAIAPNAKILLVEAASSYLSDLMTAVDYAAGRADVVAISMSWGSKEFASQTAFDSRFSSVAGATFFASSGDSGGIVSWPSSSPNVVSVGGTTLSINSQGTVLSETAWSGSGGGVSIYEAKPNYQSSLSSLKRTTPDVSYNADPNTGFLVVNNYGSSTNNNWWAVGGTSAGAPQWAAIHAINPSATNGNFYASYSSQSYSADFRDVTSGRSGRNRATTGYDLATGLGSPITTDFTTQTPPPPAAGDFSLSASPANLNIRHGATAKTTITVTSLNGYSGTVTLSPTSSEPTLHFSFSQNPLTPSSQTTLYVGTDASTPKGTYTVTITGQDGTLIHSRSLTITIK